MNSKYFSRNLNRKVTIVMQLCPLGTVPHTVTRFVRGLHELSGTMVSSLWLSTLPEWPTQPLVTYNINTMNILCFNNKLDLLSESVTLLTLLIEKPVEIKSHLSLAGWLLSDDELRALQQLRPVRSDRNAQILALSTCTVERTVVALPRRAAPQLTPQRPVSQWRHRVSTVTHPRSGYLT